MINYASQTIAYDADRATDEDFEDLGRKKDHSRGRSYRPSRRRSRRKSNQPGCGIAGRRNRRFAW